MGDRQDAAGVTTGPARRIHRVFGRFLLVGMVSYLADAGTLALLHGGAHVPLLVATSVAFAVGLAVNYALNRILTFDSDALIRYELFRYLVLVLANYVVTLVLVGGLSAAGTPYLLAKTISTAVLAVVNFLAYRSWVFRRATRAGPGPVAEP
ncbi:MAG: GtrA family protein [Pseudonocardiales bacterium]